MGCVWGAYVFGHENVHHVYLLFFILWKKLPQNPASLAAQILKQVQEKGQAGVSGMSWGLCHGG